MAAPPTARHLPGQWRVLRAGLGFVFLVCGTPAKAGPSASLSSDALLILGKSLAFMRPALTPSGRVAIVYDAAQAGSRQDAQAIMAAIGPSLVAGGCQLRPILVDRAAVGGADFQLVIVAAGANSEAVMHVARTQHALCVTADLTAVVAGTCAMAIGASGRVEITLNHEAAQSAGLEFATAFRMMVQEQ